MDTQVISKEFSRLIKEYERSLPNSYGVEEYDEKKTCCWEINLPVIKLQFIYTKKQTNGFLPASTLLCNIFLDKNDNSPYSLFQVIDYLNIQDYHSYVFSYIETTERLEICFEKIKNFLDKHLDEISQLAQSNFDFKQIRDEEYKRIFLSKKQQNQPLDSVNQVFTYDFALYHQAVRYTDFPAYLAFLNGDYKKSLKLYGKIKKEKLYNYEIKLIEFIESLVEADEQFEAIESKCASLIEAQKHKGATPKELLVLVCSWLITYFVLVIPYAILFCSLYLVARKGTIIPTNIMEMLCFSLLLPAVPSIFGGIAIGDKVQLWLSKDKTSAQNFSEVFLPKGTKKAAYIITYIMILLTTVIGLLAFSPTYKCYETYMICDVGDSDFSREFEAYNYKDIKEIYFADKVFNPYTEKEIDRSTYIFVFKNGVISSDDYNTEEFEKYVLPKLQSNYDGEIKHVKIDTEVI